MQPAGDDVKRPFGRTDGGAAGLVAGITFATVDAPQPAMWAKDGAGPTARGDGETVLNLNAVSKLYGSVRAVDRSSLEIKRGEVFTLLGPSGCGKTTTLRLVAGLEQPDEGEILLRGRPVASVPKRIFVPPHKRNLGMVFQSYAIWPHMTVFENIAYPLKLRRTAGNVIREKVMNVLDLVGLQGLEKRGATALSGGQQQRLALCRALVYEPDMLLLDEPFSNLDAKLREQMRVEVKVLQRRLGISVLFVTHDQVEALSLSDRIAVMNKGNVEQVGSPLELYQQPGSAFVRDFLGQTVLMQGTVQSSEGTGMVKVRLADTFGGYVVTGRAAGGATIETGAAVNVAIRPEEIGVLAEGLGSAEANIVPATIEAVLFVGDRYESQVMVGPTERILMLLPRNREWREGQRVQLTFPAEVVSVWPA